MQILEEGKKKVEEARKALPIPEFIELIGRQNSASHVLVGTKNKELEVIDHMGAGKWDLSVTPGQTFCFGRGRTGVRVNLNATKSIIYFGNIVILTTMLGTVCQITFN